MRTCSLMHSAPTKGKQRSHNNRGGKYSELWHHTASPAEPPLRPFTDSRQIMQRHQNKNLRHSTRWEEAAPGGREISMV